MRGRAPRGLAVEIINPSDLHPAPGFSHIVIAQGTRLTFFAGQTALDPEFNLVGGDSLFEQTIASMRNLEIAIREAGVTWDQIVRRTIYTTQPHEYETIARAIAEVTGQTEHPAQTILGVTGLAIPGLLVEVECTAVS